jgi:hypothetical protein
VNKPERKMNDHQVTAVAAIHEGEKSSESQINHEPNIAILPRPPGSK